MWISRDRSGYIYIDAYIEGYMYMVRGRGWRLTYIYIYISKESVGEIYRESEIYV